MPQFAVDIIESKMRLRSSTCREPAVKGCRRGDDCSVIAGILAYLTANLFQRSFVPVLLSGDQVFFWMDAQRLLHGDRIYRDFFQFTGPGTDLVYLVAFHLFGLHIWVTNLVVLMLGAIFGWTCFRIGTRILTRPMAFLVTALIVVVLYGRLLNATHHWFSELLVLMAALVLMGGKDPRRVMSAGSLLGAAAFFTQSRGPFAALAIASYFLWEGVRTHSSWHTVFRRIVFLVGPMILTWLVLSSYFIETLGWRQIWYWQVTYVLHYQVHDHEHWGLPNHFAWKEISFHGQVLTVYLMLPVAYGLSVWQAWCRRHEPPAQIEEARELLTLVGIASALEVAQSPSWLRVYCVAAPGILLAGWLVGKLRDQRYATRALWVIVLCLALQQIRTRHQTESVVVKMPAGTASMSDLNARKFEWIEEHTRPDDYFFQAPWPGVYLPLHLRNPMFAEGFRRDDLARPEFVTQAIRQLDDRQVQYVLWSPRLDLPEPLENPSSYHLAPFRDFLHRRYQKVRTFPDGDEIWQRR